MSFPTGLQIGAACCAAALLGALGCGQSNSSELPAKAPVLISVAEEDGVWWFKSGQRERFFAVGADLPDPPDPEGAEAWVNQTVVELRSSGFNAVTPAASIPAEWLDGRIRFISWPVHPYGAAVSEELEKPDKFSPDIFSQVIFGHVRWAARTTTQYGWNSEDVLGLILGDSPTWSSAPDVAVHPWVDAIRRRDEEAAAKRRWTGFLRGRYGSADEAGSVYGVEARSWEEIARRTEWPEAADEEAVRADTRAFLEVLAARWYESRLGLLRLHGRGPAVLFSDRIPGATLPRWLYPLLAERTDVIYVTWLDETPGRDEKLREIHEATGKPILVESVAETGSAYQEDVRSLAALPFVVGRLQYGTVPSASDLVKAANAEAETVHSLSGRGLP